MKVLIVNKFLYPNGGSETYIFNLGKELEKQGHEVQYFGMEHEGRIVGNRVNAYTEDMDFHGGSKLSKLTYPLKTIYNEDAAKKIREVLDDFWPDVVHLNNFSYQLTPSIIVEIVNWRNDTGHPCRIVFTAHDYNLICPNHQLHNPNTNKNCNKCLGGHFINCTRGKCIHGSTAKSLVGTMEAEYWNKRGTYQYIDKIICPSKFLKKKFDTNPVFRDKTIALHNFIDKVEWKDVEKKDYVLYFGRFSEEKGVRVLIEAAKKLPEIPFIFAGKGPLEDEMKAVPNITDVGFKSGEELETLIREARFSVCPSTVYENCPFSVMESQQRGTPVVGSKMGGIPELISDGVNGKLVKAGDPDALSTMIRNLWKSPEKVAEYSHNCLRINRDDTSEYTKKIVQIYSGGDISLWISPVRYLCYLRYVLYFGRFSIEKGIGTLIKAAKELPDVNFIFAGKGPLEEKVNKVRNVTNIGFVTGNVLTELIHYAQVSIYPSEWYENCPFSVMESQMYGTPVIGAKIGGIPELIKIGRTGEVFKSGDEEGLKEEILKFWNDKELCQQYSENCKSIHYYSAEEYIAKLMDEIY